MTAHVNEYNPNARSAANGVQTDPQKLKFNNIQSCIAVIVVPRTGTQLIGVHFTTISTGTSPAEMDAAFTAIRSLLGRTACDVYLVAAWRHHATTELLRKLKKFASAIYLCDVAEDGAGAANVDVKVDLNGGSALIAIRSHTVFLKDAANQRILKPAFAGGGAVPAGFLQAGHSIHQNDRGAKPWTRISPVRIYPTR